MRTLAQFLRSHRETIMREWLARSAQLPSARGLSTESQRDHVPHLLDAMAEAIERGDTTSVSLEQLPLLHADHRLSQEYGLREVVAEYRLLRRVVFDVYAEHATDMSPESRARLPPLVMFNENIDHAITDAVDHYTLQRERMREYFVGTSLSIISDEYYNGYWASVAKHLDLRKEDEEYAESIRYF